MVVDNFVAAWTEEAEMVEETLVCEVVCVCVCEEVTGVADEFSVFVGCDPSDATGRSGILEVTLLLS